MDGFVVTVPRDRARPPSDGGSSSDGLGAPLLSNGLYVGTDAAMIPTFNCKLEQQLVSPCSRQ